jgi:hypothetical protein
MRDSASQDRQIQVPTTGSPTTIRDRDDSTRTTRRDAVRLAVGGAAAALAAARLQGGLAQDATPGPLASPAPGSKEGLYAVFRTRTVKADKSIDELTRATQEGLVPIVRAIPGFVEYYVVQNAETRERTGVSIFVDKTGADESTRQVSDFLNGHGLADYYESVEPVVQEGIIVTAASASSV